MRFLTRLLPPAWLALRLGLTLATALPPASAATRVGSRVQVAEAPAPAPALPWSTGTGPKSRTAATTIRLEAPDLTPILAEDREQSSREKGSRRIGIHRPLPHPAGPADTGKGDGSWVSLPDGRHVWSLRIGSDTAVGIRLRIDGVLLPPGGEFAVFDTSDMGMPGVRHGRDSLAGRYGFWTGTVFGPEVLLECRLPAGADPGSVRFRVTSLLHRYVKILPPEAGAKQAGSCEVDVTCRPEWAQEARAVAGLGIVQQAGELFCTGCLINDLDPTSGTDFLLTANHCVGNQAEADDTEFYWFYQTATCSGFPPRPQDVPRTMSGAGFVAGAIGSVRNDFALLRLRQPPPAGAVFAAWSDTPASTTDPVTCIHHPDGDYKRISQGTVLARQTDFWRVRWTSGVTEPGSSGSPLFNAAGEVIGQLFGGTSTCADPGAPDEFGRFDRALPVVAPFLLGEPVVVDGDRFDAPIPLSGSSGKFEGNSAGASREAGEPLHAGNVGGFSVWFEWTAPASGTYTFDTLGSTFDTLLAVYRGSAFQALEIIASNDDAGVPPASRLSFDAEAGTAYRVAVDGYNGAAGLFTLAWHTGGVVAEGVPNDDFADALELTGVRGDTSGYNIDARGEPGEPAHAGSHGGASLWFRWTPDTTGPVYFDTEGSDFDTVLAVYTGDRLDSLQEVVSSDDLEIGLQSGAGFLAEAGTTYRIAVDGYSEGFGDVETGFVLLTWFPARTESPAPANDAFGNSQNLSGSAGSIPATNLGATRESGEPAHGGVDGGASVWFRWTPPSSGLVTFETSGADFDTVLAVYSGDTADSLQSLGDNDDIDIGTRSSRVTVSTRLGQTLRIAVQGFQTDNGDIRVGEFPMTWQFDPGAGLNDDFARAEPLDGPSGSVRGENRSATREATEPFHAESLGTRSVWYRWTAPEDGPVTFDTLGSTFDTVLAAYRGTGLGDLEEVASNDDEPEIGRTTSVIRFNAAAGTEYHVAIDGWAETDSGSIVIHWLQEKTIALRLDIPVVVRGERVDIPVQGAPGVRIRLERAPQPAGPWTGVAEQDLPVSGQAILVDPDALMDDVRFYRATLRPAP